MFALMGVLEKGEQQTQRRRRKERGTSNSFVVVRLKRK